MMSSYSTPWGSCYLLDNNGMDTATLVQIIFLSPGKILMLLVTEYVLYSHSVQGHGHVYVSGFIDVLCVSNIPTHPMVAFLKTVKLVLEATSAKQQPISKGQYFVISKIQFNTNSINWPALGGHLSSESFYCVLWLAACDRFDSNLSQVNSTLRLCHVFDFAFLVHD